MIAAGCSWRSRNPTTPERSKPLGPGTRWRGETIQSGTLPPETGGLDQARIMQPLSDEWTSYSGDLTGKRYSALKHVNKDTVKNLSLKWITLLNQGCGPTGRGIPGAGGPGGGPGGGGGRGGPVAASYPIVVAAGQRRCEPSDRRIGGGILRFDAGSRRVATTSSRGTRADGACSGTTTGNRGGTTNGRGTGMWANSSNSRSTRLGARGRARNGKECGGKRLRHSIALLLVDSARCHHRH